MIDGISGAQRFVIGFAQSWRSETRDAAVLGQIKSNPHSRDEFRGNGSVRNHAGFYDAFGVRSGEAMHLPPERRASASSTSSSRAGCGRIPPTPSEPFTTPSI